MQSNKEQISAGKQKRKNTRTVIWAVLLVICAVVLAIGSALAKYITSHQKRAEMESASFHISSNYLEETKETEPPVSYEVAELGGGFDILLYNYEKENVAQISGVDMTYTVTAEIVQDTESAGGAGDAGSAEGTGNAGSAGGAGTAGNAEIMGDTNVSVTVKNKDEQTVSDEGGSYQFVAATGTDSVPERTYHILHVNPGSGVGKGDAVKITVQTTAPYAKKLQAVFRIQKNSMPDYMVTDQGDGTILVTVKTNEYAGAITVKWNSEKYSPDNTNKLMESWLNRSGTGEFSVDRNSAYELLFFKNKSDTCEKTEGTGNEITLN